MLAACTAATRTSPAGLLRQPLVRFAGRYKPRPTTVNVERNPPEPAPAFIKAPEPGPVLEGDRSMMAQGKNVFGTIVDCTNTFNELAHQRWDMNALAARAFGELLVASTCMSHMTGMEVMRASVVGSGPAKKVFVSHHDRGVAGYVKEPHFSELGRKPEHVLGKGTLTVSHPKLQAHRVTAPYEGNMEAAWEGFYRRFGAPSLVRIQLNLDEHGVAEFCGGVTVNVYPLPEGTPQERERNMEAQVATVRTLLDKQGPLSSSHPLLTPDGWHYFLKQVHGVPRAELHAHGSNRVQFYCGCSRRSVLVDELMRVPSPKASVREWTQQARSGQPLTLTCKCCNEEYIMGVGDVEKFAGAGMQARQTPLGLRVQQLHEPRRTPPARA